MNNIINTIKKLYPGVVVAVIIGISSTAIATRYTAPVMLIALLLGLAAHFLYEGEKVRAGIDWTARSVLRFGIALLGLRIAIADIISIGFAPLLIVLLAMAITLFLGTYIGRMLGQTKEFGALSSGSVAVCGVSAAVAISTVLPKSEHQDRDLAVTVAGVTTLSTIAMIVYPLISHALHMSDQEAGILFGGTIHDVAQVAGAGYSISQKAGDTATFVKLVRVSALLPIVMIIYFWIGRHGQKEQTEKAQYFPPFLIAFFILAVINSLHFAPKALVSFGSELSKYFLMVSIAAIGVKTDLKKVVSVGWRPMVMVIAQTLIMLGVVLVGILLLRHF